MVVNSKQLKIASRYALALCSLGNSNELLTELHSVSEILKTSNDLNSFLLNPIISVSDKKEVLEKVFCDYSQNLKNSLFVLVEKNRFSYFESIVEEFKHLLDEKNNVKQVEIISAVELLDDEKNNLIDKLNRKLNCSVRASYSIDESILAGLVIKIGDKVIDNSLKTKFAGLKRQLI